MILAGPRARLLDPVAHRAEFGIAEIVETVRLAQQVADPLRARKAGQVRRRRFGVFEILTMAVAGRAVFAKQLFSARQGIPAQQKERAFRGDACAGQLNGALGKAVGLIHFLMEFLGTLSWYFLLRRYLAFDPGSDRSRDERLLLVAPIVPRKVLIYLHRPVGEQGTPQK